MRLHCVLVAGWLAVSIGLLSADGVRAQDACQQARLSKLQLLHSSDNESSLQDPNTLETKILNYAALHAGLRTWAEQECIPSMHVTAGDHTIPGPDGHITDIDVRSGPVATTEAALTELGGVLGSPVEAPADVQATFTALQNTPTIQSSFEVIGTPTAELKGQRAAVRSRETNLGRLASDSTLWFTQQMLPDITVDVALKNGGGIRDTILGPNITRLTVQAAFAFDNQLAILELTGAQLIAAMENAVSRVPDLDGRFPQIASMVLEYDASRESVSDQAELATPSRVKSLTITHADGTEDILRPCRGYRLCEALTILNRCQGSGAAKA